MFKFCLVIWTQDVITCIKFGDDRLSGFWLAGCQSLPFPIDFEGRPYNGATLPRALWCRRRHRVASSGRRVTPSWTCRMACLQRLEGTDPVSWQSWSVQHVWGRPGRRLQSLPSERPDTRPTWQCRALCAGVPRVSQAMWPNTDKRRLLMKSITGGKPAQADISAFVTCSDQCIARFDIGTSCGMPPAFFLSHESSVQVSAAYSKTDITRAWYRRILVLSWRILSCHIRLKEDMTDAARLILRFMSGRLLSSDFCKLPRWTKLSTDSTPLPSICRLVGLGPEPRFCNFVLAH